MKTSPILNYDTGESRVVYIDTPDTRTEADESRAASMRNKAATALAANNAYLSLASPNASQTTAQVKTLTRECNALIRLLLGLLDADDA